MKSLETLMKKYGISKDFLYFFTEENLINLDLAEAEKTLSYLISNNVSPKTIEKCHSIVLGNSVDVKRNYEYLNLVGFNKSKINNCIHILIEEPRDLINTLNYLRENYDDCLINKKLSILSKSLNYIKAREKQLKKYDLTQDQILSIIIESNQGVDYEKIFNICKMHNIKVNSKMFKYTPYNLKEKIELAESLNVPFSNYMLFTNSDNIIEIINYVKKNNLELSETMYTKTPSDLEYIFKLLKDNKINYNATIFTKNVDELEQMIEICNKYQVSDIPSSIFLRRVDEVDEILKIAKLNNIEIKASIFHLNKESLIDLIDFCKQENISLTSDIFYSNIENIKEIKKYVKKIILNLRNII